jgi:hypothetical protein
MPQYVLLVNVNQESQTQYSPEQLQNMTREYIDWVGSLIQQGKYQGGQKLKREIRTLRADNGQIVMDGPYTEVKELVGGFFQIEAANAEEAVEIAKGCPVFRHGTGTLEVREIDPVEK